MSKEKGKRTRRMHTREFKAETVALVRTGGRNAAQVARDLGLADSLVHSWLRQAQVDDGREQRNETVHRIGSTPGGQPAP